LGFSTWSNTKNSGVSHNFIFCDRTIDGLIRSIIDEFGDNAGGETETTRDYKKSLKPFFS